ncbi:MAG: inositol 2-dehydrogenase [Brevinema sp.]
MVNIGIIGAGRIGRVHTEALSILKNVHLKAIADPIATDLQEYAKSMGIEYAYKDYQDILNDKDIHAVLICTPSDTHYKISLEAIAHKKHVFCEKPVDLDVERVKDIQQKVDASGLIYMIGFNRRFDKEFMAMKNTITEGKIGDVELIQITSRDPSPPALQYIEASGGIFCDMMIHDLDMVYYLTGQEVKSVYAVGDALVDPLIKKEGDVDTAVVTMELQNGAIAVITNSRRASYGYDQRAEVHGSKGCIMNGNHYANHTVLMTEDGVMMEKPLYFFLERYMEAYRLEISCFIKAIETNGKSPVSAIDALRSLVLAKAAFTSLQDGKKIIL